VEPIFGFLLFAVAVVIVTVVARKRGQPAWGYALASVIGGFVMVPLVARAGGSGLAAGFAAFLAPVASLFVCLARDTSAAAAVERGEHGAYRKCPYCAEAIRREAIKCKHCGSEVPAAPAA